MSNQAAITIARSVSGFGNGALGFDIEWAGGRLKMEMGLEEFALLITGRGHCPAEVKKWKPAEVAQ